MLFVYITAQDHVFDKSNGNEPTTCTNQTELVNGMLSAYHAQPTTSLIIGAGRV